MPTNSSGTRRNVIGWVLALAAGALVAAFLYQNFYTPKFVVSKETTFVTAPLADDGLPDYVEYYRQISREEVTPENNAAVPIWLAVGPAPVPADRRDEFFAELGMEVPPVDGDYFQPLYDTKLLDAGVEWLEHIDWIPPPKKWAGDDEALADDEWLQEQVRAAESAPLDEWQIRDRRKEWFERQVAAAQVRPWSSAELPPLAAWVERNRAPLDLAVEASREPRFYGSFLRGTGGDAPPLLGIHVYTEEQVRGLVRGLALRAMWNVGEGRLDAAIDDVAACFRLARLESQSHMFLSQLVAQGIDATALGAALGLAGRLHESPEHCARAVRKFSNLPLPSDARRGIVHDERIVVLDSTLDFMRQWRGSTNAGGNLPSDRLPPMAFRAALDWPLVFKRLNHMFDQIDRAAATGDVGSPPAQAILDPVYEFADADWKTAVGAQFSRRVRTDAIYNVIAELQSPSMMPLGNEKRHAAYRDLLRVAFALAAYRAANGKYPESLAALVPNHLDALPQDWESQKPLRYATRDDGYLLYATGPDGVDDGGDDWLGSIVDGQWTNDEVDVSPFNHDYVVRVPIPPVEQPIPKTE